MLYRLLRRLSVAHRIVGGFLVIVLLLTLSIPLIVSDHLFLAGRLQDVTNVETRSDRLLLLAAARVAASRVNLLRYLNDYLPSAWKSLMDADEATTLLNEARELIQLAPQKGMVASVLEVLEAYKALVAQVQEARKMGESPTATRLVFLASKTGNDIGQRIEKIVHNSEAYVSTTNKQVYAEAQGWLTLIFGAYAAVLLLSLILANLVSRSITRPVAELRTGAEAFRVGQLDSMIPASGTDELSLLAATFNDMANKLQESFSVLEQREQALARERNLLRTLIDNLPDHIYVKDLNNRYLLANESLMDFMELKTLEEVIGRSDAEIFPPKIAEQFQGIEHEVRQSGHSIINREEQIRDENRDTSKWFLTTNVPLSVGNENATGLVGLRRDMTDTKRLQQQLLRSERLAATGQLAASVAHEINSPLQGIISLLSTMERSYGQNADIMEEIDLLKNGFSSIRDIVKNLLDLNRPGMDTKQSADVNRIILNTLMLSKAQLKKAGIRYRLNLWPDMPNIIASPQQLGQVFMNLINNAVEAMGTAYGAKKRHAAKSEAERAITFSSMIRGEHLRLTIADTGPGIAAEDLEHIFDPFYTRKKKMGMGVGLSVCHAIIDDHNGSLTAQNAPEGGAVFSITLPLT